MLIALLLCTLVAAPRASTAGARLQVLRVSPSTDLLGRQISVAPGTVRGTPWGDPRRLAFCGPDGIQRTLDGGQSWSRVPTDGVAALAAGTAMPLAPRLGQAPVCQSVVLDPREPDTFYAIFATVKAPQDAPPPWFAGGYVTRDAGQSWEPAPVPSDNPSLQFRGFVSEGAAVQALFARAPTGPNPDITPPVVLATTDAGRTWRTTRFACPANGACIRWGAPPTGIGSCNMHGYAQPLLISQDGGQTWASPSGVRAANACQPNELVIISDEDVLLLVPGGSEIDPDLAPIQASHDGGLTFAAIPLPEAGPAARDLFEVYLLPDERLLTRVSGPTSGPGWTWQILWHDARPPAQDRWCAPAAGSMLPTSAAPLRATGDRVWWLDGPGQATSVALADLRCAGGEGAGSVD
jgi:hypothetical protein